MVGERKLNKIRISINMIKVQRITLILQIPIYIIEKIITYPSDIVGL